MKFPKRIADRTKCSGGQRV